MKLLEEINNIDEKEVDELSEIETDIHEPITTDESRASDSNYEDLDMIPEVWDRFMGNNKNCYKPGANITVNEQLFPTKARCRFTQYIPNKPDKFGIQF